MSCNAYDSENYLFLDSILIERWFWKLVRVDIKSSSSSLSRSRKSITTGFVMSASYWTWIKLFFSTSPSSSLLDDGVRFLSNLKLTRGSKLWCFRPWNSLRFWRNSSSEEEPLSILSKNGVDLMSSETCFLDWNAFLFSLARIVLRS